MTTRSLAREVDTDERLHEANSEYEEAARRAMEALRAALTIGRVVKWRHGERERMGTVESVDGPYEHATVQVVSATTGRRYRVYAYAIRWELPGGQRP